jgi:hypothetical protein
MTPHGPKRELQPASIFGKTSPGQLAARGSVGSSVSRLKVRSALRLGVTLPKRMRLRENQAPLAAST